ncbi:MAG: VWA domain-containing protein [Anaerolineae bacterium]
MRRLSIALSAMTIVPAVMMLWAVAQANPSPGPGAPGLPTPAPGECVTAHDKVAGPREIFLGGEATITLTLASTCAPNVYPLHIVLVLDGSASTAGRVSHDMKEKAQELVDCLDLPNNPETAIGVVAFNETARTLCRPTNDPTRVKTCIDKVEPSGGSRIDRGITEGQAQLTRARGRSHDPDAIREVMLVFSDGGNNSGCNSVAQAAMAAKKQGILMVTICMGPDCDTQCMRQAATSPRYFFELERIESLCRIFDRVTDGLPNMALRDVRITDTLPAKVKYVIGSGSPAPVILGSRLEWSFPSRRIEGVTLTLRVRPTELGLQPVNEDAKLTYRDPWNRPGELVFPVPEVLVKAPPTATSTPDAAPTSRPSQRPPGWVLYLPRVNKL